MTDEERAQYERVEARARKFATFTNNAADGDMPGRPTLRSLIGEIDRIRELLAMLNVLEKDRSKDLRLAQEERHRSQKVRNERDRLQGELDAAEQHVKILRAQAEEPLTTEERAAVVAAFDHLGTQGVQVDAGTPLESALAKLRGEGA